MVRIMLQRLQCNVFMLSYRGYLPAGLYYCFSFGTWLFHLQHNFDKYMQAASTVKYIFYWLYILCFINVIVICTNSYGASDGFPSQHGITKDAQVSVSLQ